VDPQWNRCDSGDGRKENGDDDSEPDPAGPWDDERLFGSRSGDHGVSLQVLVQGTVRARVTRTDAVAASSA
jgi:hypothetical protein